MVKMWRYSDLDIRHEKGSKSSSNTHFNCFFVFFEEKQYYQITIFNY